MPSQVSRVSDGSEYYMGCAAAQNLDILAQVRRELQKEGFLKTPKVFIHPACSGDMPRLQRIVSQLGGELMPSESAPPAQHLPSTGPAQQQDVPAAQCSSTRLWVL